MCSFSISRTSAAAVTPTSARWLNAWKPRPKKESSSLCSTGRIRSAEFAAKWLDAARFTEKLRALHMAGVSFSEYSKGGFQGARLRIDPHAEANLAALGIYILAEVNAAAKPDLFVRSPAGKLEMFYKCYG